MASPIQDAIKKAATSSINVDGEGIVTCSFRFAPDFLGFSGHFPGNPILPAVIQLTTAQWMVETLPGKTWRMVSIDHAKFFEPVKPSTEVTMTCTPKKEMNRYSCRMIVCSTEKPASTFTLIMS